MTQRRTPCFSKDGLQLTLLGFVLTGLTCFLLTPNAMAENRPKPARFANIRCAGAEKQTARELLLAIANGSLDARVESNVCIQQIRKNSRFVLIPLASRSELPSEIRRMGIQPKDTLSIVGLESLAPDQWKVKFEILSEKKERVLDEFIFLQNRAPSLSEKLGCGDLLTLPKSIYFPAKPQECVSSERVR